jgi:4-methyl-5(b-hydroxyethyl)-thiazole monophosphate biosynthesis
MEVVVAGLHDGPVTASRGVRLVPDTTLDQALKTDFDLVALPGGMPGADHLAADSRLADLLCRMHAEGRFVGAVCAAPKVLARCGVLEGKTATGFPGVLQQEAHPSISGEAVIRDGTVITSRAAGTAMDFALELIEAVEGRETRMKVEKGLIRT